MSVDLSSEYLKESLCENISFVPFSPPPSSRGAGGWGQWAESLEAIDYDLRYLLKLSHDKFWSQVLYDKSLSLLLDSYLQHALRPHEEAWSVPEKALELLRNIHRRVFMTFLRLSTHKEDQDHHFSPEVFGNLVHTHSLFTVPRLLDLCSIYGNANGQLLFKMIDNVINKQPQYQTDLYSVMNTSVKEALGLVVDKSSTAESVSEAVDILLYLADITHSLSSLITVWRPAASVMFRAGIIESLVNCYELSLPILKLKLKENKTKNFPRVCYQLVKDSTSKIVHSLLMSCCHGDERKGGAEDQVLTSVSAITTGKMFYKEFEKHFSLRNVFQSLKEVYPNLDDTQLQYMLAETVSDVQPVAAVPPAASNERRGKGPSIKESVLYIKEMLPHLEEEFIKDCLKEYHYNQEVVIHHILEGTLSPHLLPQEEEATPTEATPTEATPLPLQEGQSILEGRLGAYDFDDFDIFRREDIDLSRVHVGKKFESAKEILSDKSHLRYMKGVGLDLINYDEYDDEYDDTYDSHNIGSLDQDESDDTFTVKRLNEKGQFSSRGHKWLSEEEGVAESGDDYAHQPTLPTQPLKLLQRPVTPDKIRKEKTSPSLKNRQQQRGGAKRQSGQSKGEEGGARSKRAELQHDDKKPSKDERKEERSFDNSRSAERQRNYNERHKSSRANHNRKVLSDKKRGGAY